MPHLPNRDNPHYQYDNLLRAKGLDKDPTEGITIISTKDSHDEKVYCPDCKHTMRWLEGIDCWVCNNMRCGAILHEAYGDIPLQDEQVLHTSNDPYSPDDKPAFISINPIYPEEYEDFSQQIFTTAEEAMSEGETRTKRGTRKQSSITKGRIV